ncbi:MAG: hypothetical protein K0S37_2996 [Microbacterium sp.]|jgi:hypothetical protein|nr:hypothetical protein [Microbacterium sp.]
MRAEKVTRATAAKVADVYEILSNAHPPTDTHGQRLSRARTIARARRLGYALPIEWDDIDNDESPSRPPADPNAIDVVVVELASKGRAPRRLTTSERRTAVRHLSGERQLPDTVIGRMLGVDEKTIGRDRAALNLPAAVGHDNMPLPRKAA